SVSILSAQNAFNPDTVKAQKFDTGKMWTFEYPPFEYLKQVYNFTPTQEWFDDVRLSSLRIPGCSASFVSSDGLIMTNNHCATGIRNQVQKPGEDLEKTGFYAVNLEDERKIPGYKAEQLIVVKDVTADVLSAMKDGKTEKEKIEKRDARIAELRAKYGKELNLKVEIISYYNGSIFFLQGFKVYDEVRYVFEPEEQIASFGGDPDNFVYPRFGLDCAFLRIYENGKPLKSDHYFQWSAKGASDGELVFTVGNPGTTNRLRTVAQLEYARDIQFRNNAFIFDGLYKKIDELKTSYPAKAGDYESFRVGFS
ncbi:MAG: peptidase S46, partial [Flavobacterium sp.]|nr:peptidase S46 [Flavobacterium sp.]